MRPVVAPTEAYRGTVIVFGTMHGKERQAAPVFAELLGARVVAPSGLDTDQFGTFSGDIARTLSPIDTARAKARLAMTATDSRYGLASEASYGSLPGVGWPGHEEILLFLDDTRGIEILEGNRTLATPGSRQRVRCSSELRDLPPALGWPAQALLVRPAAGGHGHDIVKGITRADQLADAARTAAARSDDGHALVEPDLRAHCNPTRRAVLTRLARTLATRLATGCPACGSPGYGRTDVDTGLPCAACGTPTELAVADVHTCPACPHQHRKPYPACTADPRWCPDCNP